MADVCASHEEHHLRDPPGRARPIRSGAGDRELAMRPALPYVPSDGFEGACPRAQNYGPYSYWSTSTGLVNGVLMARSGTPAGVYPTPTQPGYQAIIVKPGKSLKERRHKASPTFG